jgi:hypothetical protein
VYLKEFIINIEKEGYGRKELSHISSYMPGDKPV